MGYKTQSLVIPSHLRGASKTLTFRIQPPVNWGVESVVHIDNVSLHAGGRTGDILPIDVTSLTPGGANYSVIGWDVLSASGASSTSMAIERNALRRDDHLKIGGETVAYVIYSDRVSSNAESGSNSFSESGMLYFAPPTKSISESFDSDPDAYGFQGKFRLWFKEGDSVSSVASASVDTLRTMLSGAASNAAKIAAINDSLLNSQTGQLVPTISAGTVSARPIELGESSSQQQWLIVEDDGSDSWVLVQTANNSISLFRAHDFDLRVVPGSATINDVERVSSQASTVLEIAQMQQRLRYWNYPDETGELLVVDGIVGPHTRHAAGLFAASVGNASFTEKDFVSGQAFNYINSLNGPRWGELVREPSDHFELVLGPFPPTNPPRYFGTDWLVDTIRAASKKVKTGVNPIAMQVAVGALSAQNGPGSNTYSHDGHDAGMSVDFLLPSFNAGTGLGVPTQGNGILSATEREVVLLVGALESEAYAGVTLREIRTSNSDIAGAINAGRLIPLAIVDPLFAGGLHVEISPPEVSFFPPIPDSVVDEDVNNGLQDVINWLDKLITVELDKQLPALVETGSSADNSTEASTIASTLGVNHVLTGDGSILSELKSLVTGGASPSPSVLAEQLSKTQIQMYLNLPKGTAQPASTPFNPSSPSTYNFSAPLKVFDSIGVEHNAVIYFIKTPIANQWQLRFTIDGALLPNTSLVGFSEQTGGLLSPQSGLITIEDYKPTDDTEPVDLVFDFSDATQRNDAFKSGWTTWSIAAQGQYEKKSGQAGLHLSLNGRGSTGDRQFDFSKQLSELGVSLPHDIQAVADLTGTLDFTVTWNSKSSKPVGETLTVQLHDFSADVNVLVDTIQIEAKAGLLAGRIVDSGTIANPGAENSYIAASAGFDVHLNDAKPILVGNLDTLKVGVGYSVDMTCDLDGVLYFETTLGGVKIPGEFKLLVDLNPQMTPTVSPAGDLDDVLDQLKNLNPQTLADTAAQLADWLSGIGNFGEFKEGLPLGGGSFGKWANLGEELKKQLFNKFQEVQLIADLPVGNTLKFTDPTSFELTVSDTLTKLVSLPASVTANNTTLANLASDLSAAIATALDKTDFAGNCSFCRRWQIGFAIATAGSYRHPCCRMSTAKRRQASNDLVLGTIKQSTDCDSKRFKIWKR